MVSSAQFLCVNIYAYVCMCAYVGGQGPNACVSAKEFRLKLCAQLGSWLIKSIAVFIGRLEKRPCRLRETNLGGLR